MPEIRDPIHRDVSNSEEDNPDADIDEYAPQRRKMDFKEAQWFYYVRIGFLLIVSVACVGIFLCYLWHLVGLECWRWLSEANVIAIKDLALSIIVGLAITLLTTYFFKRK